MQIGYCGNVHPGRNVAELKQNLTTYTLDVKTQVRPNETMGIGLWISKTAASELQDEKTCLEFKDWLAESNLLPFTINGFPYGDFHQDVVKHEVYRPTWASRERLEYTVQLAKILDCLLPLGIDGTISTLPLGWPLEGQYSNMDNPAFWSSCAANLHECSVELDRIAQSTGRKIMVCIEPEPGCVLDTCDDIVNFFEGPLGDQNIASQEIVRTHLGVCHDVCHSAVMFEEQSKAIAHFGSANIRIGKVQVSSAVEVDFSSGSSAENQAKRQQLQSFSEPKYLHQTSVKIDGQIQFFEDLNLALDSHPDPQGIWRVHFHVPIYSPRLDLIDTTQADIARCIKAILDSGGPAPHWEVETYAWNVLPKRHHENSLADGIAKELAWFDQLLASVQPPVE